MPTTVYPIGSRVQIAGLHSWPDLNGIGAKVLLWDGDVERYECEIMGGPRKGESVRCKVANLVPVDNNSGKGEMDAERRLEQLVRKRGRSRSADRSSGRSSSRSRSSSSSSSSTSSRDRRKRSRNFISVGEKDRGLKKAERKSKKKTKKTNKSRSAGADAAAALLGLK
mmetsp:Transcript_41937/g.111042  ORF Transcript_41937/g.111042 Transcript_41937/m.111042 type:complete len:168 (-) Transcript_41937:117-620(-)|eukprot:CAMPEP_0194542234 /NCGR_PEP_ID=MMETSP0253-20130528/83673_1 /TAXON_ID=2966 /ORGANISM="Noctiluca scintillans" /LENGTH=167 /DNA_ID=CAMNT_0039388829 /DNA_START=48 /DNA_END=551 /DNA_ORIENTATION=-